VGGDSTAMRFMPARSFFDTNVLAYTDDHDSPTKQSRALALFEEARRTGAGVVSTQVMQEYFVTVTRKLGVPVDVARRKVELFARLGLVVIDLADVLAAIDLHRLHQIAFWDALVVRAAQRANCSVLYTEDMQHGRRIDGLSIRNPFL
jgi:predicted nucleic acid-binding protein